MNHQKVKITYTNEKINPVNFKEYSDFEFRWIETILTKTLKKKDLFDLLKKFGIKFLEKSWKENISTKEIGNVLISDIPKKDLLLTAKDVMKNRYPDKISFENAEKIWEKLEILNIEELRKKFPEIPNLNENKEISLSLILDFIYQKGGEKY